MREQHLPSFRAAALLGAALLAACGGAPTAPKGPTEAKPAASAKPDDGSGFAQGELTPVRSDRFGVTVPLPARAAWTVVDRDDQQGGWMVASHPPTGTVVRVRRYDETTLVGRRECELRAQLAGELPRQEAIDEGRFTTLVDEPLHRPKGWDGRRWVGFEPLPGGRLAGHVILVSGRQRACLVVHVRTEVKGDTDAEALADRLELFSSRVVGAVTVDRAKEPEPLLPLPKAP